MSRCFSIATLFGALNLVTACGSDAAAPGNTASAGSAGTGNAASAGSAGTGNAHADPNCVDGKDAQGAITTCFKDLTTFPFAAFAVSYATEGSAPNMTFPTPGRVCLSGTRSASGVAGFNLEFALRNQAGTKILKPFDAARLGIAKLGFTLDSPPSTGVDLHWHMLRQSECPSDPLDCAYPPNFSYQKLLTAGPVSARLLDFVSDDPSVQLDASALVELVFQPGPGDYDFCVHDFKMLDAQGQEIKP